MHTDKEIMSRFPPISSSEDKEKDLEQQKFLGSLHDGQCVPEILDGDSHRPANLNKNHDSSHRDTLGVLSDQYLSLVAVVHLPIIFLLRLFRHT